MTEPIISNTNVSGNTINFTLENVNVSIANALRRIIITDIPVVVLKTFPENENECTIFKNTTRMNNEIVKQRLSCVPIHIDDMQFPIDTYILEINEENTEENIRIITTEHFKIKNIQNDQYLPRDKVKTIFPPNALTKQYIDILRLRPKISDEIAGESIHLECKFSISSAKFDSMFNATSTCIFSNTPDNDKIESEWQKEEQKLKSTLNNEEKLVIEKDNFMLLHGQRIFVKDSFDFNIESIGIYPSITLIDKGCDILIEKFTTFLKDIQENTELIYPSPTTIPNSYDIKLINEDYTIGNVLEFYLYSMFYETNKLSYCGFKKFHPHDNYSVIRIAFHNPDDNNSIINYINQVVNESINTFKKIKEQFK